MFVAFAIALVLRLCSLLPASLSLARQEQSTAVLAAGHPEIIKRDFHQWPMKGGDALHSGCAKSVAPHHLGQGPTWVFQQPMGIALGDHVMRATPLIIEDQNIIVVATVGDLYKFSRTGQLIWHVFLGVGDPNSIPMTPAVANGSIYLARKDGMSMAINATDGSLLWKKKITDAIASDTSSVTIADGLMIMVTNATTPRSLGQDSIIMDYNYGVAALYTTNGTVAWRYKSQSVFYNFLGSVYKGRLVFQDCTGVVVCLRLKDGKMLWMESPPAIGNGKDFTTATVTVDEEGTVYSTHEYQGNIGAVTARNIKDGALLWTKVFALPATSSAAVGYLSGVGSPRTLFVAFQANSEPEVWAASFGAQIPSQPGWAMALNASSGDLFWEYEFPAWHGPALGDEGIFPSFCVPDALSTPAVDALGTVFFARDSGVVYALHDYNHDGFINAELGEVHTWQSPAAYQGSPAISDGMLVLAGCSGQVEVFLQW